MHEIHDICEDLMGKGEKDLKKLTEKAELSPTEWANAKTVLSAMCKMKELDPEMDGESYRNYPMPSYDNSMDRRMSSRRGRSVRTGRYISMDNRPYYDNRSMDRGTSGHSITDRMVDQIERMYDSAKTDYERQELDKWIERIQMGD